MLKVSVPFHIAFVARKNSLICLAFDRQCDRIPRKRKNWCLPNFQASHATAKFVFVLHRLAYLDSVLFILLKHALWFSVRSADYQRSVLTNGNTIHSHEFIFAAFIIIIFKASKSQAIMGFHIHTKINANKINKIYPLCACTFRRVEKPLRLLWAQTNDFDWCRHGAGVRKTKRRTIRHIVFISRFGALLSTSRFTQQIPNKYK